MSKLEFTPYDKKVHRIGFWTTLAIAILMLCVPLLTMAISGAQVEWASTWFAFGTALAVFGPVAICEFVSYVPIMGAGGLYISFVTGNVMNMKLPAARNAQKVCGVEPGTPEGEAVSVLAICVSTVTTTVILIIGMVLTAQIVPFLKQPLFQPAFTNITCAIFSAIALPTFVKALRSSSVPVLLAVALTIGLTYQVLCAGTKQFFVLPAFLVFAILWEYFLYKRDGKKGA
jgi:hypothetical protein